MLAAGSTDWGVDVNLRGARAPFVIAVDRLPELRGLTVGDDVIEIGAALTLSEVERDLAGRVPLLDQLFPQFASRLIRNGATLGGNLGTASPIGDAAPALLALEAGRGPGVRGGRARGAASPTTSPATAEPSGARGELIRAVRIPLPLSEVTAFHKIAKRRFDDISSVAAGIALDVRDGVVVKARIGLGGVAATPVRARATEAALEGRPWTAATVRSAAEVMAHRGHAHRRPPRQRGLPLGDARHRPGTAARADRRRRRRRAHEHAGRLRPDAVVGQALPHESAALHVTGQALYTDDLVGRTRGVLHAHPVQAPHAHARVTDLRTAPALAVPGVVRVLTADDVPGVNDAGVKHDEPLFPSEVMFHGHAVCWVLGETLEAARLGALGGRGRLRAAARHRDGARGDRRRQLPGRAAAPGARRRRGGVRDGAARLQRRARARRPGALLPRDALLARPGRRGGPGVRAVQHPAPHRDAGHRGARARRAQPRGHRAVPADGRRLRRQGDAAPRVRGRRRARVPGSPAARCGCGSPAPRT